MSAIDIRNLTVQYSQRAHPAVDQVSFQVERGQIAVIIGPNGSGKSSLIKALLGLLDYEGAVRLFDQPSVEQYGNIGYVPQRFSFDYTFPITVEEFLNISHLHEYEHSAEESDHAHDSIEHVLERVKLDDTRHRLLADLSGGQLQRVLLARALINEPDLLVLDEPEAGIDVGAEQTLYDVLEELARRSGVTVLLSSHELDVVYSHADQVLCLNRRLVCSGRPGEVLSQDTFEQLYGRGLRVYEHGCGDEGEGHGGDQHCERRSA
jgi:ABC-type Mn2+/Zn2+ transport system ATPase subunit